MDQGVLQLRNAVAKQEEMIKSLKDEAKTLKAIDTGLHEARRMANPSRFTVEKPIPSDFFWDLLHALESRIAQYDVKAKELTSIFLNHGKAPNHSPIQAIVTILRQQHQAFKV